MTVSSGFAGMAGTTYAAAVKPVVVVVVAAAAEEEEEVFLTIDGVVEDVEVADVIVFGFGIEVKLLPPLAAPVVLLLLTVVEFVVPVTIDEEGLVDEIFPPKRLELSTTAEVVPSSSFFFFFVTLFIRGGLLSVPLIALSSVLLLLLLLLLPLVALVIVAVVVVVVVDGIETSTIFSFLARFVAEPIVVPGVLPEAVITSGGKMPLKLVGSSPPREGEEFASVVIGVELLGLFLDCCPKAPTPLPSCLAVVEDVTLTILFVGVFARTALVEEEEEEEVP